MCGIAGFADTADCAVGDATDAASRMMATLQHRGPDDEGVWVEASGAVALAHRRLSVIDVSPAGHQPMTSPSGRYVVALNGEIYNHVEIRDELSRGVGSFPGWRGHSDTETLLAAIDRWGLRRALNRSVGMFALALWDRKTRELTLARDRMGEKPLYYTSQNGCFLFGSELKAIRAHRSFRAEVHPDLVALYLRRGFLPAPYTIYSGVFKLLPGMLLTLSRCGASGWQAKEETFWSLRDVVESGLRNPFAGTSDEVAAELEARLVDAVKLQSIADVPLGAFLSGGIDSSTVVALMQEHSELAVKTFTIGFEHSDYDEAIYASRIAEHLGTNHTQIYVTPGEALNVIPELPILYDEPFGDSSAIPTFLVAKLAREHVTVCLSGDGGDELLAGYSRYERTERIAGRVQRIPHAVRRVVGAGCSAIAKSFTASHSAWKLERYGHYLAAQSHDDFYDVQMSPRLDVHKLVVASGDELQACDSTLSRGSLFDRMMYTDGRVYLPDNILVKVDRASMAVSLESRIPMLDHRVVEFAWQIPLSMKVEGGVGKQPLRNILRKYVPERLFQRPKMGFGVPLGDWLRGELRDWAEDLMSVERLRRDGLLNPVRARRQWNQYLSGGSVSDDAMWQLLMFQAWFAKQRDDHLATGRSPAFLTTGPRA